MDTNAKDTTKRTHTTPALAGTALVLTAALALAGCGGNPAEAESTPTTTTAAASTQSAEASDEATDEASDGATDEAADEASDEATDEASSGSDSPASPNEDAGTASEAGGTTAVPPVQEELDAMVAVVEEHLGPHADALTRTPEEMTASAEERIAREEEKVGGDFSEECVAQLVARDSVHLDADIAHTQVNGAPQDMDTAQSWYVNREDTDSPQSAIAFRDAAVTQVELPACADEEKFLKPEVERTEQQPWGEGTVEHMVHGNLDDGGLRTVQTLAVEGPRVYEISHPALGADQAEEVKQRNEALLEDLRADAKDG
ncbi:hypothetical protein FM125_04015 [Micrococcus lylae]|uniref:Lipoprotein n=1 Tax=Micrococcus lylae TaxID=1273 RepID=A0A1R4ISC3_9MICC|nr:hypothetical protein [Micrococcus lylae]TFH97974.1 hypothetical protein E4A49_10805 [Micrococcus lylae]SJN22173.1 hypothetical protein FM125_04015 [Micrococcus lylae]